MNFYTKESKVYEERIKPNLNLIHNLKIRGLKDKYIAEAIGVEPRMFMRLKDEYEVFKDVYDDAMMRLCSELNDVVINRALGKDGKTDKDGNPVGPDASLAFKMLEKFDDRYKTKVEVNDKMTIENVIRIINDREKEKIEGGE